jgi:hypothetical protein
MFTEATCYRSVDPFEARPIPTGPWYLQRQFDLGPSPCKPVDEHKSEPRERFARE